MSGLRPPPVGSFPSEGNTVGMQNGFPTHDDEPRTASALPLLFAVLFLLVSSTIWVLDMQGIYPFTYNYFNVAGYLLTPFLVFMCLAWDSAAQRAGRKSPWFDIRPGYSKALRVLAAAALLVAVPHILDMGRSLGEWAVQAGVFS